MNIMQQICITINKILQYFSPFAAIYEYYVINMQRIKNKMLH